MLIEDLKLEQARPSLTDVDFHPLSFADPNGRLFWWDGQLYRAIGQSRADFYRRLFHDGVAQTLIEKGLLIETEPTDLILDGWEMVLKHRLVKFVSYPYEWCAEMLKDAALLILDLEVELLNHGLTLQDAHPWNILFDGCRPVYVDLGSIVPVNGQSGWQPYDEFCRFFIYPLRLMTGGHARIARWLLFDYDLGVLSSDVSALTRTPSLGLAFKESSARWLSAVKQRVPVSYRPALKRGFALLKSTLQKPALRSQQSSLDITRQIRREVEAITIPSAKTEWSDYYDGEFPPFSSSEGWTPKHHSVCKVFSELQPNSLLDIGSNRGWYSQLAAEKGIKVVAFDVDEECTSQLFRDAKDKELAILPLVMDFRNPSPGYGLCNKWFAPATQRLKCEMVMALALVHHLVFKRQLNFEQIVEGLSVFADKWLLVEFIPREDRYVSEWWTETYSWYTLENFQKALKERYHSIKILPSNLDSRVLLLCER